MPVRFDDRFLDEIKSRLRLSDVIGRTRETAPAGARIRRPVALHQGADAVLLRQRRQGLLPRLLERQARRPDQLPAGDRAAELRRGGGAAGGGGRAWPCRPPIPRAAEQEKERQGLADWLEPPRPWFEAELRRPAGAEARAYLDRRGLPEDEWERFRLGYAPPGRTALKDYLVAKGAQPAELVEAGPADRAGGRRRALRPLPRADHLPDHRRARADGLLRRPGAGSAGAGQVPERPGDRRSSTRAGCSTAWPRRASCWHAAGEGAALVVVEGYMDAIACQRAGVAAVAPHGHGADRGADGGALARCIPSPPSASTATTPASAPPSAPSTAPCPCSRPANPSASPWSPAARTRTTCCASRAPAALKAQLAETTAVRRGAVRPRARPGAAGHARAPRRPEGAPAQPRRRDRRTRTWPRPIATICSRRLDALFGAPRRSPRPAARARRHGAATRAGRPTRTRR